MFGLLTSTQFSITSKSAVTAILEGIEDVLSEEDINFSIDVNDENQSFSVDLQIKEQAIDDDIIESLEELFYELGCCAESGMAVEFLCEGEEEIRFYGLPSDVRFLEEEYEPLGTEVIEAEESGYFAYGSCY